MVNGESKSLRSRDLSLLRGFGPQDFQDFKVPFHMREIQVSNGFYLACHARCFHVQVFVGTKPSHAGPVDLLPRPRVSHRLIEALVGYHCGVIAHAVIALDLLFIFVELTGLQALLASLCDASSGITSLSKIPLSTHVYQL